VDRRRQAQPDDWIAPAMDSLNASVACGIALYALTQRRAPRRCDKEGAA
jgi:hypothetical protein